MISASAARAATTARLAAMETQKVLHTVAAMESQIKDQIRSGNRTATLTVTRDVWLLRDQIAVSFIEAGYRTGSSSGTSEGSDRELPSIYYKLSVWW